MQQMKLPSKLQIVNVVFTSKFGNVGLLDWKSDF